MIYHSLSTSIHNLVNRVVSGSLPIATNNQSIFRSIPLLSLMFSR